MSQTKPANLTNDTVKHDTLFTTPLDKAARFSFDEQVVACFPDMIRRSVPGYGQVLAMLPIFARRHCKYRQQDDSGQRVSRVYDLGCSLGAASMALAGEFESQDLQIKAIDISPAMTNEASTLLTENYPAHTIEVITADIRDVELEPCDMVILNLTLQFLPAADRVAVLEKIYAALSEGGILVLTEKTHAFDEQYDAWLVERYYDFKRANGYTEMEISGKRNALENVLITDTLDEHHMRLAQVGFERHLTWFQFLNFVSIVAFK
ncbi:MULTISPECIES: carboxy-S-adenosyl-L-methionine synthase CmoA [Psychrobacter]|uniref:Carboxy-S-adenosyl-L-methionine synthase n=1 Tax=Psychrobacter faecalis TaxID=180588 RepID=A0ABT9HJJ7_9GAMM|nr:MULTISPECIES: carboxy-S-adenosyl-L-methionine synthase CmoA [Psychrobacter]MDP4545948.1 carboxy-S-adenosyl-L-methionine synthase CmoA [Psychrobacter faecalis]OAP69461.1 tRNA (uridine-5-oxyacetic acid methyl ester)(34) synthase TrmP [Psychrobacter sp. SHUES1]HCR87340.1 carboxy-S-adenosyl-L-methionine synthase CmoA [Psychrobacter sp.]